jgi:hypothetical protein
MMLCLLTCAPLALTLAAWGKVYWSRRRQWPQRLALVALCVVSANAAFAASSYLYYHLRLPSSSLPPWKDPETLNFGLLFLLAPIGMIIGVIAAARGGTPKWLICILELASLPLLVIGFFACLAV